MELPCAAALAADGAHASPVPVLQHLHMIEAISNNKVTRAIKRDSLGKFFELSLVMDWFITLTLFFQLSCQFIDCEVHVCQQSKQVHLAAIAGGSSSRSNVTAPTLRGEGMAVQQ
jgi:hypothetical protein